MNTVIDYIYSVVGSTTIDITTITIRLIVSLLLGVAVGFERQMRGRDAGLRTFSLICVGSTIAMMLSIWIPQTYPHFLNGDPGRIAAQIITGIGFLGAGAIVRGRGSVQGLTTAACIWQVAIIGMAVGAGLLLGAVIATAITLFVLTIIERFERRHYLDGANRLLVVRCATPKPDIDTLRDILLKCGAQVGSYTFAVDFKKAESVISFRINISSIVNQSDLIQKMSELGFVTSVEMEA